MAVTQRFMLKDGEWVCFECEAPMVQPEDEQPLVAKAQTVEMTHAAHCPEVTPGD